MNRSRTPERFELFCWSTRLARAQTLDQARNIHVGHIVEIVLVFFLKTLTKIFRGHVAGFAIGQVAARASSKFGESRVRQAHDNIAAIDKEFRVDGVTVARGDAIP